VTRLIVMKLLLLALLILLLAAPAWAQQSHAHAYALTGVGKFADDTVTYVAAGGEYISRSGVGVAGELGRVSGARPFHAGEPERSTVVQGLYLIVPLAKPGTTGRVHPFALTGVGFLTRNLGDSYFCYMLGGGANVDLTSHVGVRAEVRRPIALIEGGGAIGALGVTFR
jgi:hypothetical protein